MSYHAEPDCHISDISEVVLDLTSCATKKELEHATDVYTSDVAAKKILLL